MTRRSLLVSAAAVVFDREPIRWIAVDLHAEEQRNEWPDAAKPVCMGSLLKPFLAVSYGATHANYPTRYCRGASTGCWYSPGHGEQNLVEALANSCNTYFLGLASALDRAALETICLTYGLNAPDRSLAPANLIGLAGGWPQSPRAVVQAFARFAANGSDSNVRLILAGMARCAQRGTARAVKTGCYAKTGTAPCSHARRGAGDGFVTAIFPLDRPRHALLVGHHNTTGASTARDVKPLILSLV